MKPGASFEYLNSSDSLKLLGSSPACNHSCCTILSKKSGAVREWDILLLIPQVLLLIFFTFKRFFKRSPATGNSSSPQNSSNSNSVLEIYSEFERIEFFCVNFLARRYIFERKFRAKNISTPDH